MNKEHPLKGILISDFNIDVLNGYLANDASAPQVKLTSAPYGAVIPALLNLPAISGNQTYDFALVWSRPQSVIQGFARLLAHEPVLLDDILTQVDEYGEALLKLHGKANAVFIPSWDQASGQRGWGILNWRDSFGITNILARMNLRLAESLKQHPHFYMLDTRRWIEQAGGSTAYNAKLWYMAQIPYSPNVFKEAAQEIKTGLRALQGLAKKLVIVDLDDTLWPGAVGESGWENLSLGGHDAEAEACVGFQKALKSLTRRGVILGIVSKNDEIPALEAIEKHPEMHLRLKDFSGWRINWKNKPQNIVELASELNLGLESIVFIDDSPFERGHVREVLPEVLVPEWPQDKMLYAQMLLNLPCFDLPSLTAEDSRRAAVYQQERERQIHKSSIGSLENWLKSLNIVVKTEELNRVNSARVTQLLNKTNQMNLSTRRMLEAELTLWVQNPHRKLWAFYVSDKFGDSGLTGIATLEINQDEALLIDFVLSCRVIGRKIEETMLHTAISYAQTCGLKRLNARYQATPKNGPCLSFFENSGLKKEGESFWWDLKQVYPVPGEVTLVKI